MKIRIGFVSNSSSSSFIVIGKNKIKKSFLRHISNECLDRTDSFTIEVPETFKGETRFGWADYIPVGENDDFATRLNFAALQIAYIKSKDPNVAKKWNDLLNKVFKEETNCSIKNNFYLKPKFYINCFDEHEYVGYIDHQSNASENKNTEMFKNYDSLRRFIFASDSYIMLDNDNRDGYWE